MDDFDVGVGGELRFAFRGFPPEVAAAFRTFLQHFRSESAEESALRVQWGSPAELPAAEPLFVTETEHVRVLEVGPLLRLEASRMTSWVDAGAGEAWIDLDRPWSETAPAFAGLILAAVLCELATEHRWWGLHAAAIAPGGRGILLPGASGSGKSTLFASCAAAGMDVLSDDLVWLRPDGGGVLLYPFPRGAPVPPSPPPTMPQARLSAIVTPTIVDRAESRITPVAGNRILGRLLGESGFLRLGQASESRFASLVRLAGSLPCFHLETGRDRQQVPALLLELAEGLER